MDYELNDQDRADLVKNFVKKYGMWFIFAILLIALGLGIDAYLQKRKQGIEQNASIAYQALLNVAQSGASAEQVRASAQQLISSYPDTIYASFAQLTLASIAVQESHDAEAESLLKEALKQNQHNNLTPVISLRLARIFLAEHKPDEAIALLQNPPKGFTASYQLLMGDALLSKNNQVMAKISYLAAQKAASDDPVITQLLAERLNSLNGKS